MEQRTITLTLTEYYDLICRAATAEQKIAAAKRLIQNTDYPRIEDIECVLDILDEESEVADDSLF